MTQALHHVHQDLSDRDASILDFEKSWWQSGLPKEQQIAERFELAPAHYYQLLNRLIDTQAALDYDPLLVKRLRRLRDQRHRERSAARSPRR